MQLEQIQNFEGKYPKQVWHLFLTEMWERFAFYGMRGMLTVFMVKELFFNDQEANLKYGAIQAFVYAFTFVGGLFADKIPSFIVYNYNLSSVSSRLANGLITSSPKLNFVPKR